MPLRRFSNAPMPSRRRRRGSMLFPTTAGLSIDSGQKVRPKNLYKESYWVCVRVTTYQRTCTVAPKQLIVAALLAFAVPIAPDEATAQGGGRSGKDVVESVCFACHGTGAQGAPKIGDRKAWSNRAAQGLTSLTQHALNGIRQMPPHGGNPGLTDLEIGRAITYMVNQSGGRWVEPTSMTAMAAERTGEQVVQAQCAKCHRAGVGGAPKIGDRDAWTPRLRQGVDNTVRSAIRGHGGMPARGGMADLTDAEIRRAITYMFNPGLSLKDDSPGARSTTDVAAAAAAKTDAKHVTVGGIEIYLGLVPAETLRAYPEESVERSMHGGVPRGAGYYHANVSLFDSASKAPIPDARVEIQIEQPGLTRESKTLAPMTINNAASYGNYLRMRGKGDYLITVRVRKLGLAAAIEAKFQHRLY